MSDVPEGKYLPIELALRLIEGWHRGPSPLPAWNELHRACQEDGGPAATGCPNGAASRRISTNEWSRAKHDRGNPSSIRVGGADHMEAKFDVDPDRWWAEYKGLKGATFTSVHINADELAAWLVREYPNSQHQETPAVEAARDRTPREEPRRRKGGRPPKHDWPAITAEIMGWIVKHGLPETKAALTRHIEEWAQGIYGADNVPAKSDIEKQITRSIEQLKKAKLVSES